MCPPLAAANASVPLSEVSPRLSDSGDGILLRALKVGVAGFEPATSSV